MIGEQYTVWHELEKKPRCCNLLQKYHNSLLRNHQFQKMYTIDRNWLIHRKWMNIPLTMSHRWGETADEETDVRRQPALSVAWMSSSGMLRVVHSLTLSSQLFLCLPRFRLPSTVPCRIVLLRVSCLVTCPNHCSLRLLTVARKGSLGPTKFWTRALKYSFVIRSR